jgi:GTP diphosphokinase / guanosine-3',5'-bis(diphosphate) 3'-diphosphatase
MNRQQFMDIAQSKKYGDLAYPLFEKGLDFVEDVLSQKERLAGDSFFDHALRVGVILLENKTSPEVVVAGMLHGILEYKYEDEVRDRFGSEIISLVKEMDELKKIKRQNKNTNVETLRKVLLTTLKDVRVMLIKLANKLDNVRTIHVFPPDEQERMAQEVLDIYAPLASRLGVDKLKVELEDSAFKILKPRQYQEIETFLEQSSEQREEDIKHSISMMREITDGNVPIVNIKGRSKNIYSIYKKITLRKVPLRKQYDLYGVRIIVPEIKDCYTLLGLLHEKFDPIQGRLKDYIASPKPNFYRSLHTGVKSESGKILEIQIRTPEMEEFAQEGVAAHWRYKKVRSDDFFEKKMAWLRGVLDLQKDNKELLQTAKIDVFGDRIHCYTPKGDMKELPIGGTILDFAYLIHEQVGNKSVGGRVNGKFVPLRYKLSKGDVVEIVTNKNQRPRRNWIKIVRSSRARQKIRKSLREHEKGIAPLHYRLLKPVVKEELGVLVESESFPNALCTLAKCCLAIPGEPIVGILTKRRLVSVHREDCRVAIKEMERWIPVNWKKSFNQKIRFHVNAGERSGVLADLLHTIAQAGFEVKEAKAKLLDLGNVECSFLVVPRDLEELKDMVSRVNKVKGVKRIYFE